ncbi:MOSC domain-containing protein [Ottowia thiooxydans]|uniref:MOSC domain-containing protein n=1 Tax=Ottowia thiooxydans TaxID=219182 RepID=UPI0003FE9E98|nr:MOSC N-terminal beta barrel domain-containing protein [Ottowia thiooxydans]
MSQSDTPSSDVQAKIARLFVHPVKSCAGVEVREAVLTETGLDLDRAWMVVDSSGTFITQRDLPRMVLIRPQIKTFEVILRAPGMLALHVGIDQVDSPAVVRVWKDEVPAWDMGDVAAQWFSDFLGQPGLRFVRFDPEVQRLASKQWTGEVDAAIEFADGFPLLVASEASLEGLNTRLHAAGHEAVGMERFRPNIVLAGVEDHDEDRLEELTISTEEGLVRVQPVKPCPRCPIPNVDPGTGVPGTHVMDALQSYRADPRLDGAISFGMNSIVREGVGHTLRVGDVVTANFKFD